MHDRVIPPSNQRPTDLTFARPVYCPCNKKMEKKKGAEREKLFLRSFIWSWGWWSGRRRASERARKRDRTWHAVRLRMSGVLSPRHDDQRSSRIQAHTPVSTERASGVEGSAGEGPRSSSNGKKKEKQKIDLVVSLRERSGSFCWDGSVGRGWADGVLGEAADERSKRDLAMDGDEGAPLSPSIGFCCCCCAVAVAVVLFSFL
ncbi:hypothetical protein QBC39DRAFT_340362 [Podospora conica]|nr:hypothetical protein QBC39DRAFT_340362 [Schizothecium conicum]